MCLHISLLFSNLLRIILLDFVSFRIEKFYKFSTSILPIQACITIPFVSTNSGEFQYGVESQGTPDGDGEAWSG